MAITKYIAPALSAFSVAYAADCSAKSGTATVSNNAAASAIGACQTYTGNIVVASGAAGGGSLDFGSVRKIDGDFTYKGDPHVNTLSLSQLKSVGNFKLSNLTGLSTLSLPALETAGDLNLQGLSALGSLGFGGGENTGVQTAGAVTIVNTFITSLDGIDGVSEIDSLYVSDNSHLQEISLSVKKIGDINIGPNDIGNGGQSASFPKLASADNVIIRNCTKIEVPQLEMLSGGLQLIGNTIESFNAPNMTSAGGIFADDNTKLTNITFPKLTMINGTKSALVLANNTLLNNINGFPKLKQVAGGVGLRGNFSKVSFPDLQRIGGALFVDTASDTFDCDKILALRNTQTVDGEIRCARGDKTKIGGTATGTSSSSSSNPAVAMEVPADFMTGFTILAGLLSLIM